MVNFGDDGFATNVAAATSCGLPPNGTHFNPEWVAGVNPWLRAPILISPERAICVSMLGKTLENLMPPLSGLKNSKVSVIRRKR